MAHVQKKCKGSHTGNTNGRDDDGDGVREVHVNTMEGLWPSVRNFRPPFRGVYQRHLGEIQAEATSWHGGTECECRINATLVDSLCYHSNRLGQLCAPLRIASNVHCHTLGISMITNTSQTVRPQSRVGVSVAVSRIGLGGNRFEPSTHMQRHSVYIPFSPRESATLLVTKRPRPRAVGRTRVTLRLILFRGEEP